MEQAAPQRSALSQFLCDLSVFVGIYLSVVTLVGFAVFIPISLLLNLLMPNPNGPLAWSIGYVLIAVGLAWRWWRHGLSPRQVDPGRRMRFRWGHVLLAVFNICTLLIYTQSTLFGASPVPAAVRVIAKISLSVLTLSPIALLAGLAMVMSAKRKEIPPEFADTVPQAQQGRPGVAMRVASAQWPRGAARVRRPSVLPVLAGLVASSMLLYIGGVFGALAFTNDQQFFNSTVLPVAIGVYALYLIAAIGLWAMRSGAAKLLAWAPVILIAVVLPAWQMVPFVFREVFG